MDLQFLPLLNKGQQLRHLLCLVPFLRFYLFLKFPFQKRHFQFLDHKGLVVLAYLLRCGKEQRFQFFCKGKIIFSLLLPSYDFLLHSFLPSLCLVSHHNHRGKLQNLPLMFLYIHLHFFLKLRNFLFSLIVGRLQMFLLLLLL